MTPVSLAALAASALLALIGAVHLHWAAGGSLGRAGAIPTAGDGRPVIAPGPVGTALVGVALVAAAAFVAAAGRLIDAPLPGLALRAGCALLALVFAARAVGDFRRVGFSKRVRGGVFARRDTYLYSPLCVLLAALLAGVALA